MAFMRPILRDIVLLILFVAAARAPFFHHPLQGDDIYYLKGAEHARQDPLHPHQAQYVFHGRLVSMLGHPHPPLNAFFLGLLPDSLPVQRVWYGALMLVCVLACYALARRFTRHALGAALLFASTPVLWVSSNTFDSDVLFLACLLTGIALFVHGRPWLGAAPLFLAGLAAYQAVVFIPILWLLGRSRIAALAPAAAVAAYQVFERLSAGQWPLLMTAQYFSEYGLQKLPNKLSSAAALTAHLGWLTGPVAEFQFSWPLLAGLPAAWLDPHPLFWASFALGVLILWRVEGWLGWWVRIFFASSLVLFFAGAARYLLPVAAPLAILAAERLGRRRLAAAVAAQAALAFALAYAAMHHWQGYKDAAEKVEPGRNTYVAGEWSLRYYLEKRGARPVMAGQRIGPDSVIVRSELGFPVHYSTGGGRAETVAAYEIRPVIPLQLMGLHAKSAWMTSALGLRPFDWSREPLDRITVTRIAPADLQRSELPMNAPDADLYILDGVYGLEDGRYRWMARRAEFQLRPKPGVLAVTLFLPEPSPARLITVTAGGVEVLRAPLQPGLQTLRSAPLPPAQGRLEIVLEADRAFRPAGDARELSLILESLRIE
jgi:4-amino-4-deoxy-L-arabinose transferase-like glycosyltransferase